MRFQFGLCAFDVPFEGILAVLTLFDAPGSFSCTLP
jgi:hypothetical protein